MKDNVIEITDNVDHGMAKEETVKIFKCVCGADWNNSPIVINLNEAGHDGICPKCKRQFYYEQSVKIFQVKEKLLGEIIIDSHLKDLELINDNFYGDEEKKRRDIFTWIDDVKKSLEEIELI